MFIEHVKAMPNNVLAKLRLWFSNGLSTHSTWFVFSSARADVPSQPFRLSLYHQPFLCLCPAKVHNYHRATITYHTSTSRTTMAAWYKKHKSAGGKKASLNKNEVSRTTLILGPKTNFIENTKAPAAIRQAWKKNNREQHWSWAQKRISWKTEKHRRQ